MLSLEVLVVSDVQQQRLGVIGASSEHLEHTIYIYALGFY